MAGTERYEVLGLAMSRFAVQNKPVASLTLTSSGNSVWLIVAISGTNADFIPFPAVDAEAVETPVTMDSRDWMEYTLTVARKTPVKGSALDFSWLLDAPAGKYGFVQCKGENFVFEKRPDVPVRFNGTNLCQEISTQFTHEESEALADQLAALGLNAVRLHHFDESLVDHSRTDGAVDPKRLDNLHYLFSALKKRGIYVTIDLFTMRTSGFPVKLTGMFDAKTRLLFSKELRANLMIFARTMLTPVNPYTGLALKDDPALITIGLINEDTIITGGHDELAYPNKNSVQHQAIKAVFEAWGRKHGVAVPEKPDHELYIRVMNEHHINIYREMTEELRKMGVRQPTSDMSVSAASINAIPRKEYDYVDNHFYFSHPRNLGVNWGWPSSYSNESMTDVLFDNMTRYLSTRIKGKPFTITEYNFCAPNQFRHEGGFAMGAYSAFQNVSGIYSFDFNGYSHNTRWNFVTQPGGHLGWFAISVDPVRLLSQRVISLLYLRGDVAAAPESETKLLTVIPADYKLKEVQEYGSAHRGKSADSAEVPHARALYQSRHGCGGTRSREQLVASGNALRKAAGKISRRERNLSAGKRIHLKLDRGNHGGFKHQNDPRCHSEKRRFYSCRKIHEGCLPQCNRKHRRLLRLRLRTGREKSCGNLTRRSFSHDRRSGDRTQNHPSGRPSACLQLGETESVSSEEKLCNRLSS